MLQSLKTSVINYAAPIIIPYAMPIAKWWYGGSSRPGEARKWTLKKALVIASSGEYVEITDVTIPVDSTPVEVLEQMKLDVPPNWEDFRIELRFAKGVRKLTKKRVVIRATDTTTKTIREQLSSRDQINFTAAVLDLGDHMQKFNILHRVRKYTTGPDFRVRDFFPTDDPESLLDGRVCRLQCFGKSGKIHNRIFGMDATLSKMFNEI